MPKCIVFLLIALLICVCPSKAIAAQQVVYVSTEDDIYELELRPNGTFVLTEDIVFGSGKDVMFADENNPFCGTFDGGGHTISYLELGGDGDVLAFIGYLGKGGVVKNLNIVNARIISTNKNAYVGGIVAHNSGRIIDCGFTGYLECDGKALGEENFIAGFGKGSIEYSQNTPVENRCDICVEKCEGDCACSTYTEKVSSQTVYSETAVSSENAQSYVSGGNKYSATDTEMTSSRVSSAKSVSSVTSVSASASAVSGESETTVMCVSEETAESDGKDGRLGNVVIYSCSAVLVISCAVAAVKEVKCIKKSKETDNMS